MIIQRRPRPGRGRILAAAVLGGAVLYLVSVTAGSATAKSALEALNQQGDLALGILRSQLQGLRQTEVLPASVALAIGQSPVLLSGQEAVLELRRSDEQDHDPPQPSADPDDSPAPPQEQPDQPEPTAPIPEEPAEPAVPLVFADNGVPARTLIPTSSEGYVVSGDVYISNRTDYTLDASLFDGTFAAGLSAEGPQVLIVHTHGSEAYTMPPGQSYEPSGECRTTDCTCNVVRVGDEIAKTLEEAGLGVIHDPTLHDYPEYSGAYDRSLAAVERHLAEYPTISLVLDVHRDAISDGNGGMYKVVSGVAGINAAQMSFVIGTDGGGLNHPDWRENLKLAAALQQHLIDSFPTLMRPITVRNSRYNQHTTPGSLLVEVGAAGNSLDEALLSARLLGQGIVELFSEKGFPQNQQ